MNAWTTSCAGSLVGWLADYYALATLLLLGSWLAWQWIRQPARRLSIAWMLVGELLVLAVVCALPGWPRFSLITAAAPKAVAERPANEEPPLARPPMPVAPEAEPEHGSGDALRSDVAEAPAPVPRRPRLTGTQWVAVGYLAGAALVVLWLSWGAVATAWLCRRARPAGPSLRAELSHVVPAAGPMPRLLVSSQVANAVALGMFRPTIVLPAALAESGPPETLHAVLAHEWAHLRHRDLWLLALGRFLLIGLYAHPLLWWLRRAIRSDQELLADALAAGDNRPQYAAELLAAVRRAAGPTTMSVSAAVGIWEGSSQLSRRIAMLLDETFRVEPTGSRRWRFQALVWLVLAGAACSLVTLQPAPSTAEPIPAEPVPGDAMKTRGEGEYLHGEVYTVTAASAKGEVYTGTAASAKDDPLPYLPGYPLLMQRGVVKALDLSDEQKNKLRERIQVYGSKHGVLCKKKRLVGRCADEGARPWDAEQQKAIQAKVEAILTPRQSQMLQWFGLCEATYGRLNELDPNLSKELGLTKEQQLALLPIRKEANDWIGKNTKQSADKMLAVLSPEQRTRLRAAALGPLRPEHHTERAVNVAGQREPVWVPSLFPYRDFSDPSLQKALRLTPEQRKRVQDILDHHESFGQRLAAEWQKLPAPEKEREKQHALSYTWTFATEASVPDNLSAAEQKRRQAQFLEKLKKQRQQSRAAFESQPLERKSIELRKQFEGLLTPQQLRSLPGDGRTRQHGGRRPRPARATGDRCQRTAEGRRTPAGDGVWREVPADVA